MAKKKYLGTNSGKPDLERVAGHFLWICHELKILLPNEDKKIVAKFCYYRSMERVSKLYKRKGKFWDALAMLANNVI